MVQVLHESQNFLSVLLFEFLGQRPELELHRILWGSPNCFWILFILPEKILNRPTIQSCELFQFEAFNLSPSGFDLRDGGPGNLRLLCHVFLREAQVTSQAKSFNPIAISYSSQASPRLLDCASARLVSLGSCD